jgi:transcriptional regulator with PAS, ATPase and Fis domain
MKINCAAIPANLLESELFGYEKGTFTGGLQNGKLGLMEICNKGTLFLDEVGELPIDMQAKLLHVVQDGSFLKLGGTQQITVDVRIVAATNRDLREDVAAKKFREDLFYRLNVFSILVPPLRQRKEDILLLANHLIRRFRKNYGLPPVALAQGCIENLLDYPWPGNVRELEAMVERSLIVNQSNPELYIHPNIEAYRANPTVTNLPQEKSFDELQRQLIVEKLESRNWKISGPGGVAELMKLNASTLRSKMAKLGIRKKAVERTKQELRRK